jgi:hypothetical protein
MTVSNLYILNTQRFLRYYDKITSGHHKTYANSLSLNSLTQRDGSISGNGNEFVVPIDDSPLQKPREQENVPVNIISPAEQNVQMTKSQLKRGNNSSASSTKHKKKPKRTNIISLKKIRRSRPRKRRLQSKLSRGNR